MLLKHVDNEDVAIEILKRFYIKEKQEWILKVRWWNVGRCHPPWDMGLIQKIRVSQIDRFTKWKPYQWRPVDKQKVKDILRGAVDG